jgi:FAD/FMN-containing dehydrogenase
VSQAVERAALDRSHVAVLNTGHGPSAAVGSGAVMLSTGRLRGVHIDAARRLARVGAGERWEAVIAAAARHGLAPLNGSSPHVGVAGYTLGGGAGHLGRRFGFAADHVRSIEMVTADARIRHVSAADPDLFWAMRGAGANFGVATALELELFPVRELVGGELCFGPDLFEQAIHSYLEWAQDVPDTMASSVMIVRYPDDDGLPAPLRDTHVTHLRVADSGSQSTANALIERLRRIGPRLIDTVRTMPYTEVGTIHHEPTDEPVVAYDRNVLLADFDHDAADVVARHAGPGAGASFLVELRAWGGALSRQPPTPNCVGGRTANWSLVAISDDDSLTRQRRDELLAAMAPWSTGMSCLNFCGVEDAHPSAVRRCFEEADFARLRKLKRVFDPSNMFRTNFNIK